MGLLHRWSVSVLLLPDKDIAREKDGGFDSTGCARDSLFRASGWWIFVTAASNSLSDRIAVVNDLTRATCSRSGFAVVGSFTDISPFAVKTACGNEREKTSPAIKPTAARSQKR